MTLPVDALKAGTQAEFEAFGKLIRGLDEAQLATPTRCDGWTVRDVAGHAIGTLVDIMEGRMESLADPGHTEEQAARVAGKSAEEIAGLLDQHLPGATEMLDAFLPEAWEGEAGPGYNGTLAQGVEALWYDTFVHADDIRDALGEPSERGEGVRCALHHIATALEDQGWGPATLALDGVERIDVGGGGTEVNGDPFEFVLVATGRRDPATFGLDDTVNIYRDA